MEKATIYDYARMCRKYHYINCQSCPMWDERCNLRMMNDAHLDKANEIILNWCKEHPVETRQDRFLKIFPNVKKYDNGVVAACPIALPVKLGDTVYTVSKRDGIVAKMVVEISWKRDWAGTDLGWGLILSGKRSNNRYNVSGIGKTVFLTKEEAEKALKGGAE